MWQSKNQPSAMNSTTLHQTPIEALVFDVFGTVVDWRGSLLRWFERFARESGVTADWPTLVDAWRGAYQPSMEPIRRGQREYVTLDVLHRESLDRLLAERRLETINDEQRRAMVAAWHRLDPWPDSPPGIARLKQKYIVAALSNGGLGLLVNLAKHARLDWDTVLSADVFRQYKPHPSLYRGAAELLGRPPESLLMVAAHPGDMTAARSCDLRTAYVDRPAEHGQPRVRSPQAGEAWDYQVSSLVELAQQLGA